MTRLRTDCAPEFQTVDMLKIYALHHITHQTTTPYNPRQNGIVERKGGTIAQMMRAIMIAGNVPVPLAFCSSARDLRSQPFPSDQGRFRSRIFSSRAYL